MAKAKRPGKKTAVDVATISPQPKEDMPTRLRVAVNLAREIEKANKKAEENGQKVRKESLTILMGSTGHLFGALDASRAPTLDSIGRICRHLGIDVSNLFVPLDANGQEQAAELLPLAIVKMESEKSKQRAARTRRKNRRSVDS